MSISEAETFKNQGNEFVKAKDYEKAIEQYTRAIDLCPDNKLYYSNRSAAYASLARYEEALEDARKTVTLDPKWAKGYSRVGAALAYLGRIDEAQEAYENGLKIEPDNAQIKAAMKSLEEQQSQPNTDFLGNLFSNPEFAKMAQDPEFLKKMQTFQTNPAAMFSDPKMMQFMTNLYGAKGKAKETSDNESYRKPESQKENTQSKPKKEEEKKPVDSTVQQAEEEKNKGNQAYKAKKFEEAIEYYTKAKNLHPNTIIYDLNISAVKFEQTKYEECITICEEAVERGRQLGEPFKLIARALARIGNCYHKQENFEQAVKFYNKSLSEFRDPEINKKLKETEKILQDKKEKEYINPEIAEKERELGNEAFSKGDYVQAVKHYAESIKRMPTEAKTYSNRAAAYTKLMEYHLCIQDCNKSIELDPKFVKSYLRKANALLAMRDPTQAKACYEKVLTMDYNNKEAYEGLSKCNEALSKMKPEEASQSALRDPEVQEILGDPSMRMVLEQMQNDPASAQSYLRDPVIMRKIEKLVSAGVIKIGHK